MTCRERPEPSWGFATQPQPAFAGFFFAAYDSLYNQPSQLAYYFSSAYAPVVASHFGGSYSRSDITTALGGPNVMTSVLFNPVFIASYLGTGETALKAHIAENDIYNWAPAVPTHLFQGRRRRRRPLRQHDDRQSRHGQQRIDHGDGGQLQCRSINPRQLHQTVCD